MYNNNSNASCHITNQNSNEDTYTYDSTYYQEDTMNNLNEQQPCFTTYVQDDMMRDVYEMNYEQEFNWNFEELQNPSTMASKLLEDEVKDFEKLVSQSKLQSLLTCLQVTHTKRQLDHISNTR